MRRFSTLVPYRCPLKAKDLCHQFSPGKFATTPQFQSLGRMRLTYLVHSAFHEAYQDWFWTFCFWNILGGGIILKIGSAAGGTMLTHQLCRYHNGIERRLLSLGCLSSEGTCNCHRRFCDRLSCVEVTAIFGDGWSLNWLRILDEDGKSWQQ